MEKKKIGQCYWRDEDGKLWLAETYVENDVTFTVDVEVLEGGE